MGPHRRGCLVLRVQITVPIYETDSAQQIAHILADADVRIVITATTQQAELVESVRTEGPLCPLLDRGAERCPDEVPGGA